MREANRWLHAQVLETSSDALPGNAIDSLAVYVDEPPAAAQPASAQGVAERRGSFRRGTVTLTASYGYSGERDLSQARLIVGSALNETAGSGELIQALVDVNGQALALRKSWQLHFLRGHHCDAIQGYLFSKPVDAEAFSKVLLKDFRAYLED